ncbi:patellin-4 [Ziziphus jujuba]|uniref:Patellin-4 n=3 Tax=Ziziphus jujuba TaxID=326968 RepID=A0A6P6GEZ6_ZIZJJ|nr:patellin-4 [Ziziphus jujuba]XP_024932724.3 patellin-4 [Ziziphus jujuba]
MAEEENNDQENTTHKGNEADENNDSYSSDDDTYKDEEDDSSDHDDDAIASAELKRKKKKALLQFRCRLEDAILGNYLLGKPKKNLSKEESAKQKEKLREITLWDVPLLPSKGHEGTDILLLKFLKARDFKVIDAFEMLRKTLKWRNEYKADEILDEKLGSNVDSLLYLKGKDKEGRPLFFTVYGALKDKELYKKTLGSEDKCNKFLRSRIHYMEKGIKKLNFKNGGVDSIVQITDLKNSPGPAMKELRSVSKRAFALVQNNYPNFIHKNVIINAPLWYYASHTIHSKLLSPKTRKKFVFARPSKAKKTLLRYIAPENLPVEYGGFNREKDEDFSPADESSELIIRANSCCSIKFPVAEAGSTLVWDITVVGSDVSYMEEFVPDDEGSYKIQLQKQKKLRESVRNSFYISEPGKIVITFENGTFNKKKVFYRSKAKPTIPMSVFFKN